MKFVILVRNPLTGDVTLITEGGLSENAALYNSEEAAIDDADNIPICRAWPWCVVEAP